MGFYDEKTGERLARRDGGDLFELPISLKIEGRLPPVIYLPLNMKETPVRPESGETPNPAER